MMLSIELAVVARLTPLCSISISCLPYDHEKRPSIAESFFMVSHVDITWNSFLPYLVNFADKLEALGFRYVDNNVIVTKEKTDEK